MVQNEEKENTPKSDDQQEKPPPAAGAEVVFAFYSDGMEDSDDEEGADSDGESEDVVVGQKFGHWDYLWIFAGFDLWIVIVDISLISASGGVLFG